MRKRNLWYSCISMMVIAAFSGFIFAPTTQTIIPIGLSSLPPPYNSVKLKPLDLGGWNHTPDELTKLIQEFDVKTIVEIGVWKGASSIHMAKLLPPDGKIYSVDHFAGSPELQENGYEDEFPKLYDQFLSNVIHEKLTHKIIPIKMSSLEAAKYLKNVNPDMVYIDGTHSYAETLADIRAWYPLVAGHGILCGDDFSLKEGDVSTAVKDFCKNNGLKYITKDHPKTKEPWLWIIQVSPRTDTLFNF